MIAPSLSRVTAPGRDFSAVGRRRFSANRFLPSLSVDGAKASNAQCKKGESATEALFVYTTALFVCSLGN